MRATPILLERAVGAPHGRDDACDARRSRPWGAPTCQLWLLVLLATVSARDAAIDLRNASVERLDNGLTVILLEDRRFPVASVQMLYRVGARDEVTGKTGLAHFLEHMAFRDSENFPGTDLVGRIYAEGGEWHGYTWIDQTTYFETVPKEDLDLLLRIEADRMSVLLLRADDMEAERGSVLAEMHMYENDPGTRLIDAVNFAVFLGHPYRNNTIGWESDIEKLEHSDVVEFYEEHYHPANAVIAVVGDFDAVRCANASANCSAVSKGASRRRCRARWNPSRTASAASSSTATPVPRSSASRTARRRRTTPTSPRSSYCRRCSARVPAPISCRTTGARQSAIPRSWPARPTN